MFLCSQPILYSDTAACLFQRAVAVGKCSICMTMWELCPAKLGTQERPDVVGAAHGLGLRASSTIMLGCTWVYLAQGGCHEECWSRMQILDDDVRRELCPDKLGTQEWLDVIGLSAMWPQRDLYRCLGHKV